MPARYVQAILCMGRSSTGLGSHSEAFVSPRSRQVVAVKNAVSIVTRLVLAARRSCHISCTDLCKAFGRNLKGLDRLRCRLRAVETDPSNLGTLCNLDALYTKDMGKGAKRRDVSLMQIDPTVSSTMTGQRHGIDRR